VIDSNGNLTDVKGLEKTAETLRALIAPGKEKEAEQMITPGFLAYIVASRYKVLFGDTIGRQATPGSSWTITNPQGSLVTSRTVTVTGQEACDSATCARLQVDFKIDPKAVADAALNIVKSRVSAAGGDPSKVTVRQASYGMSGSMLTEPATMLSHGASLSEGGTVTVADPTQEQGVTVEIKGTTELTYSYSRVPSAARPSGTKPRLAAE
jgi:VCBS repeat-containing protein